MASPLVRPAPFSCSQAGRRALRVQLHRKYVIARAEDPEEAAFEARIANLRKAKGSRKDARKQASTSTPEETIDFSDEVTWLETSPSPVDLAFNIVMAATLVWLPLTASAVGRCAFVKYKITNKRIVTITDAPWKKDESMLAYQNVDKVLGVSRGFGLYGDMVIYLKDTSKLEMRSVPDWQKVRDYILERKEAVQGGGATGSKR